MATAPKRRPKPKRFDMGGPKLGGKLGKRIPSKGVPINKALGGRPKAPTAPTPPTRPPIAAGPPPASFQGETIRRDAGTAYSTAVSGYKNALVQAALRLGSPEILQALLQDPNFAEYAGVLTQGMNDPTSTINTLAKGEQRDLGEVDKSQNEANTYFSGLRLNERNTVGENYAGQRRGAIDEYRVGSEGEYARGIGEAKRAYNAALDEALGIDIGSQLDQEPEGEYTPKAKAKAKAKGKPRPRPKPKAKKKKGQMQGKLGKMLPKNPKKKKR